LDDRGVATQWQTGDSGEKKAPAKCLVLRDLCLVLVLVALPICAVRWRSCRLEYRDISIIDRGLIPTAPGTQHRHQARSTQHL